MYEITCSAKREFNNKWFSTFSNKNVNWRHISKNPHLNMEIVLKNLNKPWDWIDISCNPKIKIKDYLANPDLPWNLERFSWSRAFDVGQYLFDLPARDWDDIERGATFSLYLEHPDLRWNISQLSSTATPDEINQHPEIQWDWAEISHNRNLTKEFIIQHQDKEWNWERLSWNRHIPIDAVITLPDKPWNWDRLSENPKITIDVIIALMNKPWNMFILGKNPAISIETILQYRIIAWHPHGISRHPSIKTEYIIQIGHGHAQIFSDKFEFLTDITTTETPTNGHWDFENVWRNHISKNKHITMDFIYANLDKPWDWMEVMKNIDITPELMRDYPNIPWNFNTMSFAKSISFSIIANNLNKNWNWQELSHKFFEKDLFAYVDCTISSLLVMTIHDFYNETVCKTMGMPTNIERILLDVYLVKMIEKY